MKKFLLRLHPVIHRHHLMSLDHLLWMIHQEDHQSQKIKRVIKEIWVTVFPLWTFWNHVFRQSSHIMAAYMNFVISLCAGIHKFQIWCHCCLFWDLTWFHQNRYTFFGYPLDLRSFFTNQYKYTRTPWWNLWFHLYAHVRFFLNMNPQQRKPEPLQYTEKLKQMFKKSKEISENKQSFISVYFNGTNFQKY